MPVICQVSFFTRPHNLLRFLDRIARIIHEIPTRLREPDGGRSKQKPRNNKQYAECTLIGRHEIEPGHAQSHQYNGSRHLEFVDAFHEPVFGDRK